MPHFSPRYCYLEKSQTGYGFNLHGEAPENVDEPLSPHRTFYHVIKAVDKHSPAQNGGLKIDDRLIGVNGFYVDNKPHNEVVQLIKKGGASSWLLVVDRQTDEHFYSKLKRKPTFADAEYGQKDKRGQKVDINAVPMEEERVAEAYPEGGADVPDIGDSENEEQSGGHPPPEYPGGGEDENEDEEAVAAVNEIENAVGGTAGGGEGGSSSHNTSASSSNSHDQQEDKENNAVSVDQQRIKRQLRNLDMASKLGVKVVLPVPENFRYNSSKQRGANEISETNGVEWNRYGQDVNVEVEVTNEIHEHHSNNHSAGVASSSLNQQHPPNNSEADGGQGVLNLDIQSARSMVKASRHQAKEAPGSWKNKWADFNRL